MFYSLLYFVILYMVKKLIRQLLRSIGFEIKRYNPTYSEAARLRQLLTYLDIDLVLDVGANIGQYRYFLRDFGYSGRIVSFEPLSSAHARLEAIAHRDKLWKIAPRTAIGDRDGEIEVNISANSYSSSVLAVLDNHLSASPGSAYVASETVKLSTLNNVAAKYIGQDDKVFLKIDVQGFERKVLAGATEILPQVRGIQIELSLVPLYEGQLLYREMIEFLEQLGYELYAVVPGFSELKTGKLLQMDGIFFKQ